MTLRQERRAWRAGSSRLGPGIAVAGSVAAAAMPYLIPQIAIGLVVAHRYTTSWRVRRRFRGASVVDFAALAAGKRVQVRGRVRARAPLGSLLSEEQAVARRVEIQFLDAGVFLPTLAHLAAQDFELVDANGHALRVEVGPSTLLWRLRARERWTTVSMETHQRLLELGLPPQITSRPFRHASLHAGEALFRDGDRVEVIGALSPTGDPGGATVFRTASADLTLRASFVRMVPW
jgi:hypothetical protein